MLNRVSFGKLVRILGAWMILGAILACGSTETEPAPAVDPADIAGELFPSAAPTPAPTAEPAPAAGGGTCSRMAACCRAYVAAMGAAMPSSTCDAYNNVQGMPDSMCEQTMAGYRSGLTAMQREVPADCAP